MNTHVDSTSAGFFAPTASLRRWLTFPAGSGALLAALLCLLAAPLSRAQLKAGDPLPDLPTFSLEGRVPSDLAGRVVVLDFWASWCGPCKASFPALGVLQQELGASGVTVLGVSVDEKKAAYEGFLKKYSPPFPTVRDAEQRLVKSVRAPKMPTTYIVDRRGTVRYVHEGFHGDASVKLLREQVIALLAEAR